MERKLKVERRGDTGKGAAHKVRAAGRVPAVVYGHGVEPIHVSVDSRELFQLLHTEAGTNVLVDMHVDKDSFLAMPREIQRDHIRGRFIHVDFLRIARDERITVDVPIHLIGDSRGVKEGGVVEHHLWKLELECFPQDVPSAVEADITSLGMNESLRVGDLRLPDKVTVKTPRDETVVSVVPPQVLKVEEEIPAEAAVGEVAAEGEAAAGEAGPES